jgi:hypothetical protein
MGYGLDGRGSIPCGNKVFFSSLSLLGPNQPPIQWVPGAVSSRVKRQGRKANHSLPNSAKIKNGGVIPPLSVCLHGVLLN